MKKTKTGWKWETTGYSEYYHALVQGADRGTIRIVPREFFSNNNLDPDVDPDDQEWDEYSTAGDYIRKNRIGKIIKHEYEIRLSVIQKEKK